MEIYQLRYFRSAAHCGNVTKAAEELNVSQPALSRAIKKLEEELGVELFSRVGRHIELNDNGAVFLSSVENALHSLDSVNHTLDRYVREKSSTLNLRFPCFFGDDEKVLADFLKLHPDVYLRCASESTTYFDSDIPDLTFFASFNRHDEPNYLKIGEEEIVLSVPRSHPLAKVESVRLFDLRYKKFVTVLPCALRAVFDGMFAEAGFEPHFVLENQHARSINRLVAHGLGIALVPSITWFSAYDRDIVHVVSIEDVKRKRSLYLKWPKGIRLSPAATAFKEYLVKYYQDLKTL